MRVGKAKNRERPMVGNFTSICLCEEHLPILGNLAICRARPGRAATEVLPALQSLLILLKELGVHPLRLIQEAIEKFVAARQPSDRPIVRWAAWLRLHRPLLCLSFYHLQSDSSCSRLIPLRPSILHLPI
jgi:hypothetical protein